MTDADWSKYTDPKDILNSLPGGLGQRKRLLFAVACCRRLRVQHCPYPTNPLIDSAELFADGQITVEAMAKALAELFPVRPRGHSLTPRRWEQQIQVQLRTEGYAAVSLIRAALGTSHWGRSQQTTFLNALFDVQNRTARKSEGPRTFVSFDNARQKELQNQAHLLRDIVPNPFRPPVDTRWLTGNDTLPRLALAIYTDRAFERMPILADALEEAGCTDALLLAHCRGLGPHVRGCWVVDLILSKDR